MKRIFARTSLKFLRFIEEYTAAPPSGIYVALRQAAGNALAVSVQKAVPNKYHYYRKRLRYYLDFCQKYGFRQSDTKSLLHFIKKLKEKKQTDLQQKQAADTICIYYGEETIREDKNVLSKTNNKIISSKKNNLKPTNASWVPEYNDLN
ncbi:hypothetical protein ACFL03_13855 [Thermodesulfobacteriota bacterium]